MADEAIPEDAADGLLSSNILILCRECINRAQIWLLNTKHNPIAFNARAASRFFGHINC